MNTLKAGFIVCASHKDGIQDPNGAPYVDELLIQDGIHKLRQRGIDCLEYPLVVSTKQEAKEAFRAMAKDDSVQSLIIFPGTWNWVGHLTAAIRDFSFTGKGILLWVHPGAQGWRTGSGLLIHGALKEIAVKHRLVYGSRNDEATLVDIHSFVLANQIRADLNLSTFCLLGGRGQAQSCGSVDPSQWMHQFGIDIDSISPLGLFSRLTTITDHELDEQFERISGLFGQALERTDDNTKAVKLYIALKDLVVANNYLGIGIQNYPGLADYYTIPSLAQSLLIEDRIGNSALGDMNVALSTYILMRASGDSVFFGDVQDIDVKTKVLKIVADGAAAPSLASKDYPLSFSDRGIGHEGDGGGLTVSLVCREGTGVLAKLMRDSGQMQMVVARCEVFVPHQDILGDSLRECGMPFWPHAFTKVHGDLDRLIQVWGGEYICLAYGDFVYETLVAFCRAAGIECIEI